MIEFRIDSHDISDMDERLDRAFDIKNEWGSEAVSGERNDRMATDNMFRFPEGSVQAVLQRQQATIEYQHQTIALLIEDIKKLDAIVNEITDCLDSAGQNFFKIGMKSQEIK